MSVSSPSPISQRRYCSRGSDAQRHVDLKDLSRREVQALSREPVERRRPHKPVLKSPKEVSKEQLESLIREMFFSRKEVRQTRASNIEPHCGVIAYAKEAVALKETAHSYEKKVDKFQRTLNEVS